MDNDSNLFDEFPPVSTKAWEEVIQKDLRGADYKQKLNWHTGEGIEALPFYRKEDLQAPSPMTSGPAKSWEIRQSIFEQSISKANATALRAIGRGADALCFTLNLRYSEGMQGGDLEGTAVQNQEDFNNLLSDIDPANTAIHFHSGMLSPALAAMLKNYCRQNNMDTSTISGSLLYDPCAFILRNGLLPKQEDQMISETSQLLAYCSQYFPDFKPLGVDARIFHDSGATIAQELGFALATGSEYLAKLSDADLSVDTIARAMHFNFSIGSNYFLEIAKLRAARMLWQNILQAYKAEDHPMYIHGSSSLWNQTVFDPFTNMLRSTTEGMSAAIAGCDAISINPFDAAFSEPDEFSQRVARNQQVILKEEAYLDKVSDPSAGSYYIEQLTDKIAKAAWKYFQEIEVQGGMLQSITDRYVQIAIEKSRKERDQQIASRGRIFVGTNQYPNPDEQQSSQKNTGYTTISLTETDKTFTVEPSQIMPSLANALQNGATLGDLIPGLFEISRLDIRPLRPYRGAEAFEELRLATKQHHNTPKVLNVPMGDKKMRKARSAFANNFFGCVGYDIEDPVGFNSVKEATSAITKEKPDIIVLCSSDGEYENLVPELGARISELKQKPVFVLAGFPKDQIEAFKQAGVGEFIHAKGNVLETLTRFQQQLGVIKNAE